MGILLEAWVTTAVDDDQALRALMLAESLKRSATTRQLVVIFGTMVSKMRRDQLRKTFDAVLKTELFEGPFLKEITRAQATCISVPLVKKCVYLNPNILVLRNADQLFELEGEVAKVLPKGDGTFEPLVVVYSPSDTAFETSMEKLSTGITWYLGMDMKLSGLEDYICSTFDTLNQTESLTNRRKLCLVHLKEPINGVTLQDSTFKTQAEMYFQEMNQAALNPCKTTNQDPSDKNACPIAIIGMACRFAGCDNKEEFWEMLINKKDGITVVPENRWSSDRYPGMNKDFYKTKAGFIHSNIDEFDGKFFGMSPYELEFTDPQQRMLLEVVWESLEDAAVNPHSLHNTKAGIYTGTWLSDYKDVMMKHGNNQDFFRTYMGNGFGATAGRLAHFLGTTGPNIATESGCSSSMVAVGMGMKNLRSGSTNLAICCGVNLMIHPFGSTSLSITSPNGRSKTFDADADGFGRGEGCGVLVLKRLQDAVRDNDRIYALLQGYGEGQEGPSSSMGTPTVAIEALAMQNALNDAATESWEVSYLESHGTGTPVGDPLEFEAINRVYASPKRTHPLHVGSVKPNVGHTESCSGITGIIKTVLALNHEIIPPHIGCTNLNPRINLKVIPAQIPFECVPWKRNGTKPRKAGVSSFGITGTDAHVILEEAPVLSIITKLAPLPTLPIQVLSLSAKSEEALDAMLMSYKKFLRQYPGPLSNVTFTANTGRAALSPFRAAVVGTDAIDIATKLENGSLFKRGQVLSVGQEPPKLIMVFSGQNNYYHGMGQKLYKTFPVFQHWMNIAFKLIHNETGLDFKKLMWEDDPDDIMKSLNSIGSLSIQYAIYKLWESLGVKPDIVLGHSLGEYMASLVAGFIDFKDAVKILVCRQKYISSASGKMLAVKTDPKTVEKLKREVESKGSEYWLDYSCFNGPTQIVVGGPAESIADMEQLCQNNNIKCTIINDTLALHTRAVKCVEATFRDALKGIKYKKPIYTYISGTLGCVLNPEEMADEYWIQNLVQPVRFEAACLTAYEMGARICLDVGPHPILATLFAANVDAIPNVDLVLCIPSLRKNADDVMTIMTSIASMHVSGFCVDWFKLHEKWDGEKTALPTYPFQRKSYWFPQVKRRGFGLDEETAIHPLLGHSFSNASTDTIFQSLVLVKEQPYLEDHKIGDHIIFPAAGFVEMFLAGGQCGLMGITSNTMTSETMFGSMTLMDIRIRSPLRVDTEEGCELQTLLGSPNHDGTRNVFVYKKKSGQVNQTTWVLHAESLVNTNTTEVPNQLDLVQLPTPSQSSGWTEILVEPFYETLDTLGLKFGPLFRSLNQAWMKDGSCCVKLNSLPMTDVFYFCHPIVLDAMIQASILVSPESRNLTKFRVPISITSFTWYANRTLPSWIIVKNNAIELFGSDGTPMAIMKGVDTIGTTVFDIERAVEEIRLPMIYDSVWEQSIPFQTASYNNSGAFVLQNKLNFLELIETTEAKLRASTHYELNKNMDRIVVLYFIVALSDFSWDQKILCLDEFVNVNKIQPKNTLMIRRFCEMLEEDGYLHNVDGHLTFKVSNKPLPTVEEALLELELIKAESDGSANDTLFIITSCMEKFVPIAQGLETPLPILFPSDPNKPSAKSLYRDSIVGITNNMLADVVSLILECTNSLDQPLRVLEVGAGTGSCTSAVLPLLKNSGTSFIYTYTDLSPSFFVNAETEFGKLDYQILDIEKDPLSQGFSPAQFDLVIAANVLHATQDITVSISNCRILTRNGGKILMLESFHPSRTIDSIFGLLDGYWRFTDRDLRPWHTLVDYPVWEKVMNSSGFEETTSLSIGAGLMGVVMATASEHVNPIAKTSESKPIWLLLGPENQLLTKLGHAIEQSNRMVTTSVDKVPDLKSLEGVLYLWGTSQDSNQEVITKGFFELTQQIYSNDKTKVVVVTMGSGGVDIDDEPVMPTAGSLYGIIRTFRNETKLPIKSMDLESEENIDKQVSQVLSELWSNYSEVQIAYRNQKRLCLRVNPTTTKTNPLILPNSIRSCLQLSPLKSIDSLSFKMLPSSPDMGPKDIEVRVESAALNFKDILNIIKPDDQFKASDMVAQDVCGVVVAVGSEVTRWDVGNAVMGINTDQFLPLPTHIRSHEDLFVQLPDNFTYSDGASLPTVFLTAYHCLVEIANLKRGEIILIHTASGGVGLCAIQVARHLGANIIVTAGSKRKRAYLREIIGLEHVFQSRSLSFGDEISRVTNGRGVDVVLNSLTSSGFKETTLKACSTNARFIEMSKLNIWDENTVKEMRPDIMYAVVKIDKFSFDDHSRVLQVCGQWTKNGWILPLPSSQFDSIYIRDALTYLQKTRQIGKVIINMPHNWIEGGQVVHEFSIFNDRSTYLITGGLGGIGLETAKWMIEKGAKNLMLVGRKPPSASVEEIIQSLISCTKHLQIITMEADVGKMEDCRRIFSSIISANLPPLRGIFHAAGNLSDATLPNQTWDKFGECFGPKVDGTWNLHLLSLELKFPLDHFVLYSSIAALFGMPGQASHASANSYMDALAHHRASMGLNAISINWGQWGQVGVAANVSVAGIDPFSPSQGLAALNFAIHSKKQTLMIADFDVAILLFRFTWLSKYFSNVSVKHKTVHSRCKFDVTSEKFWEQFDNEGVSVMEKYISQGVGMLLKFEEQEQIDIHKSFQDMGLDSLMVVELKNILQVLFGSRIPLSVDTMSDCNNVALLSQRLSELALSADGNETVDDTLTNT